MTGGGTLLLAILSTSLIPSIWIFLLREETNHLRNTINLTGAGLKVTLVALLLWGVLNGSHYEFRMELLPGMDLLLSADALSVLFVSLSALLWLATTVYAVGYMERSAHRSRFFGFFSLCVSATVGIALAGNLLTFLIFYELLTLSTYPLVVHDGTPRALRAGNVYLAYTLGGGTLVLAGTAWLHALTGTVEFAAGGSMAGLVAGHRNELTFIFCLLILGLGVKAALYPLHGWLPNAMVAPTPVSALLHAVAVVKAGAFGIIRMVYDVFGINLLYQLHMALPLAGLASVTIIYGSIRALTQDDLKKRLAFSTVSQVSYIMLGTALLSPVATVGGMVHLVHQGLMKVTLFFCAGILSQTLGIHKVSEMKGVGRRMPMTMAAFTIGALAMIGLPPMAGFISKWHLGVGALDSGREWVVGILLASSLLNAAYFLPILRAAWFEVPEREFALTNGRLETKWMLLLPPLATATAVLAVGLLANVPLSPLKWTRLIVEGEYGP